MGKKRKYTLEEVEVVSVVEEVKTEETSTEECLVVEEVADDICLEESVESPKDDIKEEIVEEIEAEKVGNETHPTPLVMDTDKIMDTIRKFGKCKIVADELTVYNRSLYTRNSKTRILKKGETFYFDRMHTTSGNNIYVSWTGSNGRRDYALFKNLTTGTSPVIKIG